MLYVKVHILYRHRTISMSVDVDMVLYWFYTHALHPEKYVVYNTHSNCIAWFSAKKAFFTQAKGNASLMSIQLPLWILSWFLQNSFALASV
jgi:hypothetical protein